MATGAEDPELQGNGGYEDQSSGLQMAIVMAGPLQIATGSVAERSLQGNKSNAITWFGGTVEERHGLYLSADAHHRISPATCPIFFMTGEHDNPARNKASRESLARHGITTDLLVYPDGKHGCWNRQPWFDQMVPDMAMLLRAHLKSPE